MEQEYTTSTGYKIFYGLVATLPFVCALFIYLAKDDAHRQTGVMIAFLAIGIITAGLTFINALWK